RRAAAPVALCAFAVPPRRDLVLGGRRPELLERRQQQHRRAGEQPPLLRLLRGVLRRARLLVVARGFLARTDGPVRPAGLRPVRPVRKLTRSVIPASPPNAPPLSDEG